MICKHNAISYFISLFFYEGKIKICSGQQAQKSKLSQLKSPSLRWDIYWSLYQLWQNNSYYQNVITNIFGATYKPDPVLIDLYHLI